MCNKARSTRTAGNLEENTNVGLLNFSSNSQSTLSLETILEVLSFVILTILVIRWLRKCLTKRKMRKEQRLASIIQPSHNPRQSYIQEIPNAPGRSLMGPTQMPMAPPMAQQPPEYVVSPPIGINKYMWFFNQTKQMTTTLNTTLLQIILCDTFIFATSIYHIIMYYFILYFHDSITL